MSKQRRDYLSYLLRLWRTDDEEEAEWRASLESPYTGERRGFATVTDLFSFLEREVSHAGQRQARPHKDGEGGDHVPE
jgi:hypothetical protein